MYSQKSKVLNLYKNLLFMGRDYPLGYEYFRSRCHKEFLKNSKETNPQKIKQMILLGKYIMKELEAMYHIKKYRYLKNAYYREDDEHIHKILENMENISKHLSGLEPTILINEGDMDVPSFLHSYGRLEGNYAIEKGPNENNFSEFYSVFGRKFVDLTEEKYLKSYASGRKLFTGKPLRNNGYDVVTTNRINRKWRILSAPMAVVCVHMRRA